MTSVFHKILRAVAGAMEIPDVVFLVLALGFAVFSVGWLICEYFTEHRHMREDLPRLLDALREQGADTATLIRKSQLNRRQKAALLELTEHFPHRQVAGFPPVSVSQRRFGAGSVGMHDETRPVVARQKIRNDFTKRLGVKPLVDAFDRSVHVLFRRRNPASRVT